MQSMCCMLGAGFPASHISVFCGLGQRTAAPVLKELQIVV
jgi:hypothetical protein